MTYTDMMKRAFHSIQAPKGFYVDVIDNEHFITLKINERVLMNLSHDDKIAAIQYVVQVKSALEQNGAVVLVTRDAIKNG